MQKKRLLRIGLPNASAFGVRRFFRKRSSPPPVLKVSAFLISRDKGNIGE
jgi:hypothetical protein